MKTNNVRQKLLTSDWLVLIAVCAVGCIFLPFGPGWREFGIFFFVCGLCMWPFYRHGYKIKGESGLFRAVEIPVSRDDADEIMAFLNGETAVLQAHPQENGGALLSLYYRKNGGYLFAQYFDYVKTMQGTTYPVVKLTPEQSETLKKFRE